MLTTQMYFSGDPHLGADRLLNSVPKAEQNDLIIEPTRRPGANSEDLYAFDIHLLPLRI
jgi:protocatechuate 3,4-dioxygenase beta subunit